MRVGHSRPRAAGSRVSAAPARISRAWRALRTGLAFGVFGAGALFITIAVLPILRLCPGPRECSQLRVQRVIHLAFRLFAWFMAVLGLIRVSRVGMERLQTGSSLVIANHPTLIDVVLLVACMPQADCIVKKATLRNPFFRLIVTEAGYLANDEGALLVESGVRRLREQRSLLLFPEGKRSPQGRLGPFHRGAAHVALKSRRELIPVVITCEPPTLLKGQKWYDVPDRPAHLTLRVEDPISPAAYLDAGTPPARAARQLTGDVRRFYEGALSSAGV